MWCNVDDNLEETCNLLPRPSYSFIDRLENITIEIWDVNIKIEYNECRTLSLFQASFIQYRLLARVVSSNYKGKRGKRKIKSLIYFLYRFLHMNKSLLEITTIKMTIVIHKRKVIFCENIWIYHQKGKNFQSIKQLIDLDG